MELQKDMNILHTNELDYNSFEQNIGNLFVSNPEYKVSERIQLYSMQPPNSSKVNAG